MKAEISNLNWRKVILGILAGIITLITFSIDRIDFLASLYEKSSAFNYSVIITSLYILGIMNVIGGLKREYTLSFTYIVSMVLYDLLTEDLPTLLFAGVSLLSLIAGSVLSIIVSRLMDTSEPPVVVDSGSTNQMASVKY